MNFYDKVTVGLVIVSAILIQCDAQFKVIRLLDSDLTTPKTNETKTNIRDDDGVTENVSRPLNDTTEKITTSSETSAIKIHLMDSQEVRLSEVTNRTEATEVESTELEVTEVSTKTVETTTALPTIELGYKPRSYQSKYSVYQQFVRKLTFIYEMVDFYVLQNFSKNYCIIKVQKKCKNRTGNNFNLR